MIRIVCAALTVSCGLLAAPAAAQSLADVARKEEARRATAKKAVKVFTNANIGEPGITLPPAAPAVTAPPPCDPSAKDAKCAAPKETAADAAPAAEATEDPKRVSVVQRASQIRARLSQTQKQLDSLKAAAGDQSRSANERTAATRMAAQVESALAGIEGEWRALETEVASQSLPREWLNPIPPLSMRSQ